MQDPRFGERGRGARAGSARRRMPASTADLRFTLRAGLTGGVTMAALVAYALFGLG